MKSKLPQSELADIVTGELFQPKARNHYEENDGVPFAPPVDMPRPTVRQRIENLLNRGVDPLAHYVGSDDYDLEIPDDPEAPLTPSEANYIDALASSLAEQAPLPDEGLPRPAPLEQSAPTPAPGPVAAVPPGPAPAQAPAPSAPVPSR